MTIPLTVKQKRLLDYLDSCEICPSFDEMRTALGVKGKAGVHRLVEALEERGFIRRLPNRARAIEVVRDRPQFGLPPDLSEFTTIELIDEVSRRLRIANPARRQAPGARPASVRAPVADAGCFSPALEP